MHEKSLLDDLSSLAEFAGAKAHEIVDIDNMSQQLKSILSNSHPVLSNIKWNQLIYTLNELKSIQNNPQKKREQRLLKEQLLNDIYQDFMNLSSDNEQINHIFLDLCSRYEVSDIILPANVDTPQIKESANKDIGISTFNRQELIDSVVTNLSPPLVKSIKSNTVPFIKLDDDPPQVLAIKDLINASAQIEEAYRQISEGGAKNYLFAVYRIYQAYSLLSNASPELSELVNSNIDYLKPLMDGAQSVIKDFNPSKMVDLDAAMSKAGQFVNYLGDTNRQPDNLATLALSIANQLPQTLDTVYQYLTQEEYVDHQLELITQKKIEKFGNNIDAMIKLATSSQHNFSIQISPIAHIKSVHEFKNLLNVLVHDSKKNSSMAIKRYEQWLEQDYPSMILWLDGLEDQLYLKKGTLTDGINQSLDKLIVSIFKTKTPENVEELSTLGKITQKSLAFLRREIDSKELSIKRIHDCDERIKDLRCQRFKLESEYQSIKNLFNTLDSINVRQFGDLPEDVRSTIRNHYPIIQPYLDINATEERELVDALNAPPISTLRWLFGKLVENPDGDRVGHIGFLEANQKNILEQLQNNINRLTFKEEVVLAGRSDILKTKKVVLTPYLQIKPILYDKPLVQYHSSQLETQLSSYHALAKKLTDSTFDTNDIRNQYLNIQYLINNYNPSLDSRWCALLNKGEIKKFKNEYQALIEKKSVESFVQDEKGYLNNINQSLPDIIPHQEQGSLTYRQNDSIIQLSGILNAFKEYQLSQSAKSAKLALQAFRKDNLNNLASRCFDNDSIYQTIHSSDPESIRHIKQIENCLTGIEDLLLKIESIDADANLLNQMVNVALLTPDILSLLNQFNQLNQLMREISPEVYEVITPFISDMYSITNETAEYFQTDDKKSPQKNKIMVFLNKYLYKASITQSNITDELSARYLNLDKPSARAYTQEQYEALQSKLNLGKVDKLWIVEKLYIAADNLYHDIQNLGKITHEAITKNSDNIQRDLFNSILNPINEYEDKLLLKPGQLLDGVLNQFEHSYQILISELDIPFEDKIKILDHQKIYDDMINNTNKRKAEIFDKINKYSNTEPYKIEGYQLELSILNMKIGYLKSKQDDNKKQLEQMQQPVMTETLSENSIPSPKSDNSKYDKMLKMEIDAAINQKASNFKSSSIKELYINSLRQHVNLNFKLLSTMPANEVSDAINKEIETYNPQDTLNYHFIDDGYQLIFDLNNSIDEHESNKYLTNQLNQLKDIDKPISEKVDLLKTLPKDQTFLNIAATSTKGLGILGKLERLINQFEDAVVAFIKERKLSAVIIAIGSEPEHHEKMSVKKELKGFIESAKELDKGSESTPVPGA